MKKSEAFTPDNVYVASIHLDNHVYKVEFKRTPVRENGEMKNEDEIYLIWLMPQEGLYFADYPPAERNQDDLYVYEDMIFQKCVGDKSGLRIQRDDIYKAIKELEHIGSPAKSPKKASPVKSPANKS